MKTTGGGALRVALDWLYPPRCMICDAEASAPGALCAGCWREIRWIGGDACAVCAAPLGYAAPAAADAPAPACQECGSAPRPWRRAAAVCLYEGAGRKLVLALKEGDRLDAAQAMGAWMARAGGALLQAEPGGAAPLVTPAPLHWTRRLGRRFNQALELAAVLARASGAPLEADLVRRTRRTPAQSGLTGAARRGNLADAFALAPGAAEKIAGRRVVLIDDVMTTGATLAGCAEPLIAGGAEAVDVIVFARAARDPLASARAEAISALSRRDDGKGTVENETG